MPTKAKAKPGRAKGSGTSVQSVTPCLTFVDRAEEAANFYVSVFKGSRITSIVRSEGGPIPKGNAMHVAFKLSGREFTAFDGGPSFSFSQGFSMVATCKTQKELDEVWAKLASGGGEEGPCGWLTDRFGVSWQVVPAALGRMMANPKGGNAGALMEALLKMGKLDLAELQRAYKSK